MFVMHMRIVRLVGIFVALFMFVYVRVEFPPNRFVPECIFMGVAARGT